MSINFTISSPFQGKHWFISVAALCLMLVAVALLSHNAGASCPMCAPDYDTYPHEGFLNSLGPEEENYNTVLYSAKKSREENPAFNKSLQVNNSEETNTDSSQTTTATVQRSENGLLIQPSALSRSDIVLDISDGANSYIDGALSIPYTEFFTSTNALKSPSELAKIIGDAGISNQDKVVIYGECVPCGGGPSAATYAYWVLSYIGHPNLKLMDGGLSDWQALGYAVQSTPSVRNPTDYTVNLRPELLATYDYVANGGAQIVDARSFQEFGTGKIPQAINIPYDQVLQNGKIKDEASLKTLFASLDINKPVVVYTNTGVKASMVWFALMTLGYDARLYTYQDWQASQPTLNLELNKTLTNVVPNSTTPGLVRITAVFEVPTDQSGADTVAVETQVSTTEANNETDTSVSDNSSSDVNYNSTENGESENVTLKTMGCSTCSPITLLAGGSLNKDKSTGIQLGSYTGEKSETGTFEAQAIVLSQDASIVSNVNLVQTKDDEYSGTWDASNVDAGTYVIDITASVSGVTKRFSEALTVEILPGEASKFKKLG